MQQALLRFAQTIVGGVEFGVTLIGGEFFGVGSTVNAVGMKWSEEWKESLLQRIGINPRKARLVEQKKIVDHSRLRAETFAAGTTASGIRVFHFETPVG